MELPDGRTIRVISQPTPDGNGWVVTHEDISERRRTEMERDRSQAFANTRDRECAGSTIVLKDAHSLRYMLINRAGEEYFGVPRKDDDRQAGARSSFRKTPPTASPSTTRSCCEPASRNSTTSTR